MAEDQAGLRADPGDALADMILPGFISRQPDGIYVDPDKVPSADEFRRIVERVFASGFYFSNLDYPVLQALLFDFEQQRGRGRLRLAGEIRKFAEARRQLYRAVKVVGGEVEYIFEPVYLESTVDEPVIGTDENGEEVVLGSETRVIFEKTELNPDEFVADLWQKGVRFGLDLPGIRECIASGKPERRVIARERKPTAGRDAGIEEQTEALHRDNAPRELASGKLDLRQFKNRFPQIGAGTLLLMKTPRELGQPGRAVTGALLEADLPKDFDLSTLAGAGTRIERHGDGEYIVAAIDGFINLDSKTNQISVTEKIINREGVSARTTGNLALSGDEYEEFGEVQDGRVVEGKSLTFHAPVFGKVVSSGGRIVIEQNISGGSALNWNGPIEVNGLASGAYLRSVHGRVTCKRAENTVLVGDIVELEWATNCVILADEIHVEVAEGCALAGKHVRVGTGRSKGNNETLISLLMPDTTVIDQSLASDRRFLGEDAAMLERLEADMNTATQDAEVQKYLNIAGKLQRHEITLSPAQLPQWQQMTTRLGSRLRHIGQVREDIKALREEMKELEERIARLEADKEKASSDLSCQVETAFELVRVRLWQLSADELPLAQQPPRELGLRLRGAAGGRSLFVGDSGSFAWTPKQPTA